MWGPTEPPPRTSKPPPRKAFPGKVCLGILYKPYHRGSSKKGGLLIRGLGYVDTAAPTRLLTDPLTPRSILGGGDPGYHLVPTPTARPVRPVAARRCPIPKPAV
jgi:hypothetical protein